MAALKRSAITPTMEEQRLGTSSTATPVGMRGSVSRNVRPHPPVAREPHTYAIEWWYWRGSPELVAQVARAACRGLRAACRGLQTTEAPTVELVVTVGDDSEVFDSPERFIVGVSPEALRDFADIRVIAHTDEVEARIIFNRSRSNSLPLASRLRPGAAGYEWVRADVSGGDDRAARTVADAVHAALKRGAPWWYRSTQDATPPYRGSRWAAKRDGFLEWCRYISVSVVGGAAGLALAALASYLVRGNLKEFPAWAFAAGWILGGFAALIADRLLLPDVEIASYGQAQINRLRSVASRAVVGLLVAALTREIVSRM
jgi:hypothetical protein